MADEKNKLNVEAKTKVTKTKEEISKRKLNPRGDISTAQGTTQAQEQIPQRNLTPRGNVPLGNAEPPAGQATQQEATPGARQIGQPQAPAEEQIPQRELTPQGEIGQTQTPQAQGQGQKTLEKPEPKPDRTTTPSMSDADIKNKKGVNIPTSKQDLKDEALRKATEPAKKAAKQTAKKLGQAAAKALAQAAAEAGAAIVAFFGWWVLAIVAIIVILILILCLILYSSAANGYFGKASPVPAGTVSTNPDIKKAIDYANKATDVAGYNQFMFLKASDKDYLANSGKIDARLVKALDYLISKHKMVRISHIISDYDMMNTNEVGSDTNPQIIKNITAHKDGLAADTDEIDFVYKTVEPDEKCQSSGGLGSIGAALGVGGSIAGIGSGDSDIVYYNDLNQELLRLYCHASVTDIGKDTNTTFNSIPAQAIPIQINWQDCKPNITHAGNLPDPCTTFTDPTDQEVYQTVYQPEARRKVHLAITELLKWPYDSGDVNYNRITQLITFSYDRDVQPFEQDGTLDKLYGLPRPANYGLFYMLEAWQNIHIGY